MCDQPLFAVQFGDPGTDEIRLGVHPTCEGYRSRADRIEARSVSHRTGAGKKGGDLPISSSNPKTAIVLEQLTP